MQAEIQDKKSLIETFRTHDSDTGSPEVQIALLSARMISISAALL